MSGEGSEQASAEGQSSLLQSVRRRSASGAKKKLGLERDAEGNLRSLQRGGEWRSLSAVKPPTLDGQGAGNDFRSASPVALGDKDGLTDSSPATVRGPAPPLSPPAKSVEGPMDRGTMVNMILTEKTDKHDRGRTSAHLQGDLKVGLKTGSLHQRKIMKASCSEMMHQRQQDVGQRKHQRREREEQECMKQKREVRQRRQHQRAVGQRKRQRREREEQERTKQKHKRDQQQRGHQQEQQERQRQEQTPEQRQQQQER